MFFKSSENSCCGSVTIKSERHEPGPAVCDTYLDASLQDVDGGQEFWNREMPFETPSYDSPFTFSDHGEVCSALDVCPGHLPAYSSCRSDVVPSSTGMASLGTVLTESELPLPVRCLLTPPDSLPSLPDSPHNEPVGEEMMSSPEEVECPAFGPDDAPSPPENSELVVLTPVTRRPRRTHPGCTTIKYNRKNNPELDRRRVHFCDFPGKSVITIRLRFDYDTTIRRIARACFQFDASKKQESPAVADKPARRLRKVCTVYVRAVGL